MTLLAILVITGLSIFLAERILLPLLTKKNKGKTFFRNTYWLHPNVISTVRLPMGLLSVLLWAFEMHSAAILNITFWMITDLSDGTIARNCDLITEKGKWLDPLSDKCLYMPPLAAFAVLGILSPWTVAAIIVIDFLGQFSRFFVQKKAANNFGKTKTALITILLALTAISITPAIREAWPFLATNDYQVFLQAIAGTCALFAFLSFYCKVIPDNWYANSLTLVNFLCGIAAVICVFTLHAHLTAFVLIFIGQFCDLFDGRLAERFGSTRFGATYDDIADGTSFGLAISCLVFHTLVTTTNTLIPLLIATIYFVCVMYRLIRFIQLKNVIPDGIFKGLPAPGGALLSGSATLLFSDNHKIIIISVLTAAVLMVSPIHYLHFAKRIWPGLPNILKVLFAIFVLLLANYALSDGKYSWGFTFFSFCLALTYLIFGLSRIAKRIPFFRDPNRAN